MRAALSLCALLFVAGCADDNPTLFISSALAPQVSSDACSFDVGNERIFRGTFNVNFPTDYTVWAVVNSQMVAGQTNFGTVPGFIQVTGAEITLLGANGTPLATPFADAAAQGTANPFSVRVQATLAPSVDGVTPSQSVVQIPLVPQVYRQDLAGLAGNTVVAAVRPFGRTTGGLGVTGDEWLWPIDLCGGSCTFVCPAILDMMSDAALCSPGFDSLVPNNCACSPEQLGGASPPPCEQGF